MIIASVPADKKIAVIKAVLHHRGIIGSAELRLPLVGLSPVRTAEVLGALGAMVSA